MYQLVLVYSDVAFSLRRSVIVMRPCNVTVLPNFDSITDFASVTLNFVQSYSDGLHALQVVFCISFDANVLHFFDILESMLSL